MIQLGAVRSRAAAVWPELSTTAVNAPGPAPLVFPQPAPAYPNYPAFPGSPGSLATAGSPVGDPPVPAQPVRSAAPPF